MAIRLNSFAIAKRQQSTPVCQLHARIGESTDEVMSVVTAARREQRMVVVCHSTRSRFRRNVRLRRLHAARTADIADKHPRAERSRFRSDTVSKPGQATERLLGKLHRSPQNVERGLGSSSRSSLYKSASTPSTKRTLIRIRMLSFVLLVRSKRDHLFSTSFSCRGTSNSRLKTPSGSVTPAGGIKQDKMLDRTKAIPKRNAHSHVICARQQLSQLCSESGTNESRGVFFQRRMEARFGSTSTFLIAKRST
ncbi:hypothetical protein PHSY_001385 [Pseudozyma hubeiensis SY62]|uniref:Uncharacterized protein n=1 Tax=Pseudozyma hubeiensis (strain SY62) TaxID=1305764 RepID=R9P6Y3_PSEHS|nr:hypothetical protein PHSY_001385 [Pseudozyma hubeiensis SY62]GAC93820.1 hypothetical protein PHSY_001385 [Pseudozyma hubeiensis SY62]